MSALAVPCEVPAIKRNIASGWKQPAGVMQERTAPVYCIREVIRKTIFTSSEPDQLHSHVIRNTRAYSTTPLTLCPIMGARDCRIFRASKRKGLCLPKISSGRKKTV